MNLNFLKNSVAMFIVIIIALLIVPLPTWLLDFMFILNLALSLVILLLTMYIKEALDFSIFPSILLLTTLLRLGLNVSSTRSILTNNGYAGEVVKTFGEYVIRGDVVVGLVIFIIIVLVQFIVITKGAERVAEVSARFTLDAMPGKQMAIDADLSSGIIDEQEAKLRRGVHAHLVQLTLHLRAKVGEQRQFAHGEASLRQSRPAIFCCSRR